LGKVSDQAFMGERTHKIESLRLSGTRFRAHISGIDDAVLISDELVAKYHLKVGTELTESQVDKITAEAELFECDRHAARLLGMRDHSIGELKAKLGRRGFTPSAIKATAAKYVERGMLDDARYARMVARRTLELKPAGKAFITAYLRRKMIPRELANRVVAELFEGRDEVALALMSLRKRWSSLSQLDLERAKIRAYTYLGRRGISYEAARAAFAQLCAEKKVSDND
jgi:regulatory protein